MRSQELQQDSSHKDGHQPIHMLQLCHTKSTNPTGLQRHHPPKCNNTPGSPCLASHTCQAARTPSKGPCTAASHPCREHMMPSCPATTTACFYSLRGGGRGVENQHQSDVEQLTLTPPICNIIAAASQTAVGRGRQHGQC